ncbi:MAG: hypothetical protein ACQKBV_04715 [Puniceicoccales bacterium]
MLRILSVLALAAVFTGCNATEEAVDSDRPLSESTGNVLGEQGKRQKQSVDGMYEAGSLNDYEKEQMDKAIGN